MALNGLREKVTVHTDRIGHLLGFLRGDDDLERFPCIRQQIGTLPATGPGVEAANNILALTAQPAAGTTVVTTGITQPDYPRAVRIVGNQATCAGNVVVVGTDVFGNAITDTIALNGVTAVNGVRAFKTITSITIPTQGAGGDQASVGGSGLLGLRLKMPSNQVFAAFLDGVKETTNPTVTAHDVEVSKNTVKLNSALAATKVVVVMFAGHV